MKKNDFIKYCDFVFQILFEFDRRYNFTSDEDVENYMRKYFKGDTVFYQSRLQGYLSERISNVFYLKHFNASRIKIFPIAFLNDTLISQ